MQIVSGKTLPDEIMLELRDCLSPFTNGYIYQELQPVEVNDDGTFTARITRGKHDNRRGYERWVRRVTNRSIYFHYRGLLTDISQSARTGTSFVTRCPLQGKILQKLDAPGRLSRRMLEIEIPFLQDLSLQDIFRIRTDYEQSVTAFRRTLRDCAVEMERASEQEEIRFLQQRFRERIADEGLDDLRQKLASWKRRSIQDTALLAVPAVLGYMGSPSLLNLAAGAVSLLQGALGAYRHHQEVIQHPVTSRTWFEHILTRLTPSITLGAGQHARRGLLDFLFNHADIVLDYYRSRSLSLFFRQRDLGIHIFTSQLIRQMLREDRSDTLRDLNDFIKRAHAVEWVAGYMRDLLWLHGAAGDRPGSEEEKLFSADEIDALRLLMAERMAKPDVRTHVLNLKEAGSYLWAWRDIAGVETVRNWVNEACQEDASFLHMLLCLRTAVSSSNRGEYLRLDLAVAEKLTEQTGHFRSRLDAISARNQHALSPLMDKVHEDLDNKGDL